MRKRRGEIEKGGRGRIHRKVMLSDEVVVNFCPTLPGDTNKHRYTYMCNSRDFSPMTNIDFSDNLESSPISFAYFIYGFIFSFQLFSHVYISVSSPVLAGA